MTIIHLISGIAIAGGAENMVYKLSKKCLENNIKPVAVAITSYGSEGNIFTDVEHHFLNVHSISHLRKGLKKLHKIVKQNEDVVFHSHMFHACMLSVAYSLFYKKTPIVYTMHNNIVNQIYRRILLFLTKPMRKVDIIFSDNSQKWYLNNKAVIPNGLEVSRFKVDKPRTFDKNSTFDFLYLGRLEEQKNPFFMIDLANALKSKNYNFLIHVVGTGVMKEEFEQKIKSNKLEDCFKVHGVTNNVIPFLQNSHCLIMPSLWEGMPVTLIEAAAASLPIISTPVGSIPDFLNKDNAYLPELNDFGATMMHVIDNYEEATKKSEILLEQTINKFDIQAIFDKHLEAYTTALNG